MEASKSNNTALIVGIIAVVLCICVLVLGLLGYFFYSSYQGWNDATDVPSNPSDSGTETPAPEVNRPSPGSVSSETLETLKSTIVPENDPYELACRLQGICDVSRTVPGKSYKVGDKETFWILNSDTVEQRQISATLRYITPHSYFWVEDGTPVDEGDMKRLMDTFETKIYPTDREFFGSESIPGVDGDPHIFVIYASSIGNNIAGYFNSSDSYNPLVKEYSNAHESYVLGTSQDLGDEYTYSTLAHEFVHMIQFASDRNDVSWINEGFAEVGTFLNGYYAGGADWFYVQNPDMQLNTWVDSSSPDFGPHYGQSLLFLTYYLDRFGEVATKALIANPENDLTSVDDTLRELNINDPQTGQPITMDDVFMDWAVAVFLHDASVADGRYAFHNYDDAPQAAATETISECTASPISRQVNQFGMDYIAIECEGDLTLNFTGSTAVGLLPIDPNSGDYAFWSNKGDESDMTLTREFDFTGVSAPVNLTFHTWYDLEEDYDYLFLEASVDGNTWEILTTPSGTDEDPSGNSYGWGYNGKTGTWIEETVDLSKFAGKKVSIRFEYITDAAVNGEGLFLDDVSLDAVNYSTDFEADDGGWTAVGFVRVNNVLPQTFRLALINLKDETTVEMIPVTADVTASVPLSLGSGDQAVLVVVGTTRFTTEDASYEVEVK